MNYKIFVSYKYADNNVAPLDGASETTVRTYVDVLESYFDRNTDVIYKGESDDEDLREFSDDQIWTRLKDRIYDSSVTIVLASPGMKELDHREDSQWIPWEVSYSLRETERNDRTSHSNAMVMILLPDRNGSYSYAYRKCISCNRSCNIWDLRFAFKIIADNLFNKREKDLITCADRNTVYSGEPSYIVPVTWEMVLGAEKLEEVIKRAVSIQQHKDDYDVHVEV